MKVSSRTIEQKTNAMGFPKPGEFIEMTGVQSLEASGRALFSVLYQHAHDSGRILDPLAEWEIPLVELRNVLSRHDSNDRLRESLEQLRSIKANIYYNDENGEPRVILTELFDFFDIPTKAITKRPTIRFGIARKIRPILETSGRWGRIKAEIVCAMTSKYAIAVLGLPRLFRCSTAERCVSLA
jgi:hypothetical protein